MTTRNKRFLRPAAIAFFLVIMTLALIAGKINVFAQTQNQASDEPTIEIYNAAPSSPQSLQPTPFDARRLVDQGTTNNAETINSDLYQNMSKEEPSDLDLEGANNDTANDSDDNSEEDKLLDLVWEPYEKAEIRILEKVTARTSKVTVPVGPSQQFDNMFFRVQACKKPPEIVKQDATMFVQIWEEDRENSRAGTIAEDNKKGKWIFSGWMFSSAPALSAMEHPIYDIWLLNCQDKAEGKSQSNFQGNDIQDRD